VRNVFTPHQPISERQLLFGRQEELRALLETINTPGQHVLLYGERGVGKSSLANVVAHAAELATKKTLHFKRCDRSDVFATIVSGPLRHVGADLTLTQVSETSGYNSEGALSVGLLNVRGQLARQVVASYQASGQLSPSSVAEALAGIDGLLIVDEAEAISGGADRRKLAELIKLLSDSGSVFKVMVVGIAQTGGELTAAHPSVQRCLRETKLRRMTDSELREIVVGGAKALDLGFEPEVVNAIVSLSAGYPHFTHLLALKCAEDAIVAGRKSVDRADLNAALERAVSDAEGTLRRIYEDSARSTSDAYRQILAAAAAIGPHEFTSVELRDAYERVTGDTISQGSLNNYFQRLVSRDGKTILRRTGQGHYRFEDPRMASYVRIANKMI
jgi:Cdc6-like AAA superfamily ATPase